MTNRDLNATLPFMTVDGEGTVNLLTDALDFDLVATFVDGEALQSQPLMADLAGDQLPLEVGGTVAEPSVLPDFSAMIRSEVQEAVDERVEEERSEVEERIEQERDEAREELRDRLRGLFE